MFVNHLYAYDRDVDAQFYACILQPNDPLYQFVDKSSLDDFEKDPYVTSCGILRYYFRISYLKDDLLLGL